MLRDDLATLISAGHRFRKELYEDEKRALDRLTQAGSDVLLTPEEAEVVLDALRSFTRGEPSPEDQKIFDKLEKMMR